MAIIKTNLVDALDMLTGERVYKAGMKAGRQEALTEVVELLAARGDCHTRNCPAVLAVVEHIKQS